MLMLTMECEGYFILRSMRQLVFV